jgi:hypothetical protein
MNVIRNIRAIGYCRILVGIVCAVLGVGALYCVRVWMLRQRAYNDVLAKCSSDVLHPTSLALSAYLVTHDAKMPSKKVLRAFAQSINSSKAVLNALDDGGEHYVWNEFAASDQSGVLLPMCWCSPAMHDQFVSVMLVSNAGQTDIRIVTFSELAKLLSAEIARRPGRQ